MKRDCGHSASKGVNSIPRSSKFHSISIIISCIVYLGWTGCVSTPKVTFIQRAAGNINRVSVLDFSDAPGAEAANSGQVVAGSIVSELMKISDITVLERKKLATVLKEQALSMTGLIDDSTAVKIGKMLGVNGIVFGSVSQYGTSSIPIFLGLFTYYQDVYNVAANLRIVNVETGEIVLSGECSAKSSTSYQDAASKVAHAVISHFEALRIK